uniref:F-box domain-containing protein n=1 Tax=Denticeps clupeoides TaxID=299321 RepID=A0AAY4CA55_9TELE
ASERQDIIYRIFFNLHTLYLYQIFQGLGVGDLLNCAQVCRTWMSITQNCSLWSQINFSDYKTWISDSMVKKILQKYRMFVSRLNMRGCTSLQESSFKCISECRNLQELNLSECCNINDEVVQMIAENCPSLLYLNLSYTTVTDATFRALSRCCLNLQYVSLAYCRKFTDKGLQCLTIGMGCRRIVYLDLSGCTQITVMGFRHIGEGCRLLQHVVFNDMPTLSDRCVKELTSKCHCLISISLLDSIHVSDSALKAISDVAHLSQFEIEGNSQITDAGWKDLCRSSPKLQLLRVADCPNMTDISMKSIGSLKKLTYLDISGCESMSDVGLRAITEGHSASRIQELHLSSCICISDLSMMWIAQRCSKLSNLNLCYCQNLTDSGFELLAGCLSLVSLDITGCNISDQGLVGLGGSQSLKKLNISECIWISDIVSLLHVPPQTCGSATQALCSTVGVQ